MSAGEKKPGPDAARLKELLERTGYEHCITADLRKYGGPPPDWEGDHPGAGHEVYCGNIPRDVYEDKLIPMFEKCGKIWELRLMTDPARSLSRGHCIITFVDKEAADEAVKRLNNYEITPGKHLQVNITNARLFVGNIPRNKSKEEIMEEFSKLSENLKDVIIYGDPDDPRKKNRGFALLDYPTNSDAYIARRRIGNCLRIWQRKVRVEWADHQTEPNTETLSKVKVLYVDNLKSYVTEEQLEEHFKSYGKIECVQKMRHHGFIHFEDRDDALKAMKALNGSTLAESEIAISFAKRPPDVCKRTPGGADAKTPCPNQARLKEILERTGYQLQHKLGQHQYGGPPPDWEGDQPGAGHEVFCRNIPRDVFEDELIPLFEKCGKIWVLRLMMDSVTHLNRGFCFITFVDKDAAAMAVKQLHNHEIKPGMHLRITMARTRLFVGNIPYRKTKAEVMEAFSELSENLKDVILCSAPDDPQKSNRVFAMLEYCTASDANTAKTQLGNGRTRLWGCNIIVDWANIEQNRLSKLKALHVRNLKPDVTKEQLREHFESYGTIGSVKKIKGSGFIHFAERDSALNAMNALNGSTIGESKIAIALSFAKPRSGNKIEAKGCERCWILDDWLKFGGRGFSRAGRMTRPRGRSGYSHFAYEFEVRRGYGDRRAVCAADQCIEEVCEGTNDGYLGPRGGNRWSKRLPGAPSRGGKRRRQPCGAASSRGCSRPRGGVSQRGGAASRIGQGRRRGQHAL